jgi:RNA recognition motif-containing protein
MHATWLRNKHHTPHLIYIHESQLRTFFSECGTVTRINLPKGAKFQPNKGFAYIDFDSREALEKALEKSESNLDGRRLLIKSSTDYKGRPKNENVDAAAKVLLGDQQDKGEDGAPSAEKGLSKTARKILERQKNPPAPTLFIGNLGFDATVSFL